MASCFFTPGYWKITKDFQVYVFHDKEKENENGTDRKSTRLNSSH